MGNEVDHIQPGDVLLGEKIDRLRLLLAENGDQNIGAGDFLVARRLHMQHSALQHPLKAQGGLGFAGVVGRQQRRGFLEKPFQLPLQLVHVGPARPQHLRRRRVVQQGEQQMLDGHEFMTLLSGFAERAIESELQFLAQHGDATSSWLRLPPSRTTADADADANIR